MREIELGAFATAHAEGVAVIDVREPAEYAEGHVPGAQLVPLSQLPLHLSELPRDERVYLICAAGKRSLAAVELLTPAGVDAVSVTTGTTGWKNVGKPLTIGTQP